MIHKLIVFFLITIICFGCNKQKQMDGYTRDSNGFYYKLLSIGDGNESPLKENIIVLDVVMKTQSDSVFWDTKHDAPNGLFISLDSKLVEGSCRDYYLKMVEGDSVSFLIKPSAIFRDYFDTIAPDFCKNDSLIKMNVKLNQIISGAEFEALKKNAVGQDVEEDTELQ